MLLSTSFNHAYADVDTGLSPFSEKQNLTGIQVKIENFTPSDARQIKAAGFGFVRFGVWTNRLDSAAYQAKANEAFAAAKTADLPVLLTVRSTETLVKAGADTDTPAQLISHLSTAGTTFANTVISLENTYSSQLLAIEIWNEPDLPEYWPTQNFEVTFVPFMSAVCKTLQNRNRSIPIIGFGFAHSPAAESKPTLALSTIINNFPRCLSAVSYHPYGKSAIEIDNTQKFIKQTFHIPGVITEWGIPSLGSIGGEEGQATGITGFIATTKKLKVPLVSIYEWKDTRSGSNDGERNFGLITADGPPKSSETAVKRVLLSQ